MKYICTLLLIVLLYVPVLSQEKYVPGSVVTLNGDTLKGLINDELWNINPKTFDFKSKDGSIKKYGPTEVKAFILIDRTYRSCRVSYDSASEGRNLSSNPLPSYKTADLFLQVIVGSKKSLLEFIGSDKRVHYFIDTKTTVEELVNHPFVFKSGSISSNQVNPIYLQQLQRHFADCPSLEVSELLRYSRKALKEVFEKYNSCPMPSFKSMTKTKLVSGFVPGLVVNLKGDTIKGQVNDELWIANPTQIAFKAADGTETKYRAPDIKAFMVADRMYRSYRVSYDSSSIESNDLSTSPMPAYKTAHLFLMVLVDSKKSLLQFFEKDLDDRVHYFIESDGNAEELVYHRFAVKYNDMLTVQFNKIYTQQLQKHFADCPQVKVSSNLSYAKEPLKKLFREYNTCKGNVHLDFDHAIKPIVSWGLKLGTAYEGYRNGLQPKFGKEVGLSLSITTPRHQYKTAYIIEFSFHKFPDQTIKDGLNTVTVGTNSWKLNLGLRTRLSNSDRNKAFLIAGAALSFGLQDKYNTTIPPEEYQPTFIPLKGGFLGVGTWVGNSTAIDLRYELGSSPGLGIGGYSSVQFSAMLKFTGTK